MQVPATFTWQTECLSEGRQGKVWTCVHMWFLFPLLWNVLFGACNKSCRGCLFGDPRWQIFKYCYFFPLLIQLAELPAKCLLGSPSFHKGKGDVGKGFALILTWLLLKISWSCLFSQTDECGSPHMVLWTELHLHQRGKFSEYCCIVR